MEIPDKMIDAQAENMVQDMARRMAEPGTVSGYVLKVHRHDCRADEGTGSSGC